MIIRGMSLPPYNHMLWLARSGVVCLVATVSGYHACEFSKVDMLAGGAN
jgi:hypothetical protein